MRIVFREPRTSSRSTTWLAGSYDLELVRATPSAVADAPDTVAERSPTLSTYFLAFNADDELMADERVRRALAHAIDRRALLVESPGVDLAAERGGAIPPVMPGHGDAPACPTTSSSARELLAEAGYPGGDGLPRAASSTRRPWSPTAALAEQLAAVGVRARVRGATGSSSASRPATHAWFAGWHADYPDPDGFYLGLLELSLPIYRDEETRRACSSARASRDRDERLRLYREFERSGSASARRSCRSRTRRQLSCAGRTCTA